MALEPTDNESALNRDEPFELSAEVVVVGLGIDPVVRLAETAAAAALDRNAYVDVVLGGGS
ncbi:MAG: hypothetical protein ABEL76_06250 [Bradymonadaceae bacterium]